MRVAQRRLRPPPSAISKGSVYDCQMLGLCPIRAVVYSRHLYGFHWEPFLAASSFHLAIPAASFAAGTGPAVAGGQCAVAAV